MAQHLQFRTTVVASILITAVAAASATSCVTTTERPATERPTTTSRPATTSPPTTVRPATTLPNLERSNGVAATIRQFREDEANDTLQIELVREIGPATVDATGQSRNLLVSSVQLRWPGQAQLPPTARQLTLAPGMRVDVPTPIGTAVCGDSSTQTAGTSPPVADGQVVIGIETDSGPGEITVPLLADAAIVLDRVYERDCAAQRFARQVGIEFGDTWVRSSDGRPRATGELRVTRRDTVQAIRIVAVNGSVLLDLKFGDEPEAAPPVELPGGTAQLSVPMIVLGSGRCDAHALGESKKTFEFQVSVAIGNAEPVGMNLAPPLTARPTMQAVISDTCGAPAP